MDRPFIKRPVAIPVLMLVLYIVLAIAGIAFAAACFPGGDLSAISTAVMDIAMAAACVSVLHACRDDGPPCQLKKDMKPLAATVLPICLFAAAWLACTLAYDWAYTASYPGQHMSMPSTAMAMLSVTLVPVTEELLFRGIVFGRLCRTRLPVWACALASSACFALCHGTAPHIVPSLLLGMTLCWLYASTGRLWPCILAHCAYNALSLAVSYPGSPVYEMTAPPAVWVIAAMAYAAVIIVLLTRCGKDATR